MTSKQPSVAAGDPGAPARWLPLFLTWLAISAAYFDTARAMVAIWSRSDTFAHAFLVPPITAWLIWRRRDVLATLPLRPDARFLLPMAAVGALWLLGDLSASNSVTQFAFVAMLVLAVPAVMGWPITHAILFPLGFLFFAVPFGEFLMPQLMEGTADFTVLALQLSGIPVFREGLHFVIPTGNWSVVEACSGVRYLIASVMVGTLFAYLNYRSMRKRLLFVGVSFLVPVVANWVRAYTIVLLGHVSGNTLAAGVDHLIYGWAFFGVVIALMFMIGARWSDEDAPPAAVPAAPTAVPPSGSASAWGALPVSVALCAVLALPLLALWQLTRLEAKLLPPELALPNALPGGCSAPGNGMPDWKPGFANPAAEASRTYACGDRRVGLYVGYYRNQRYDSKLVSSENVLVNTRDPLWMRIAAGTHAARFGAQAVQVRSGVVRHKNLPDQSAEGRLLAWQVYWVNGTLTSSDARAKLIGAVHRLLGRGDDAAVLVFYTPQAPDETAPQRLQDFLDGNFGAIEKSLAATRERRVDLAQPRAAATHAAL